MIGSAIVAGVVNLTTAELMLGLAWIIGTAAFFSSAYFQWLPLTRRVWLGLLVPIILALGLGVQAWLEIAHQP